MSREAQNAKLLQRLDEKESRRDGRMSTGSPTFQRPSAGLKGLLAERASGEEMAGGENLDLGLFEKTGKDLGFRDFFDDGIEGAVGRAGQDEQAAKQQKQWAQKPSAWNQEEEFVDDLRDMHVWEIQDAYETSGLMHNGRIPGNYGQFSESGRASIKDSGWDLDKGVPIGVNMDDLSPEAAALFNAEYRAQPTAGAMAGPAQPEIQGRNPQETQMKQFQDRYKHARPSKKSQDYKVWEQMRAERKQ